MKRNAIAGMAVAILTLAVGTMSLRAEEKKHDRADALAAKLALNDEQKGEIRKVFTEFEAKMDPIEDQVWMVHHEARAELHKLLNNDQRAKMPEVVKEECEKQLQAFATKLGLTDQQKQQVEKTAMQFEKKFKDLAAQNPENARKQFRELKHELFTAVGQELTNEERIRAQGVLREEFHQWRQPEFRREHLKVFADKLALNAEQRTQAEKILTDCEQRIEKPVAQLKELHEQELAAMDKVLNDEQRAKLKEIMKSRGRNQ